MPEWPRFKRLRYIVSERTLMRYGMAAPQVGDIVERDGERARVVSSDRPEPLSYELRDWDMGPGDFISRIEYEYVDEPHG